MNAERIAKLPKWAQEHIRDCERQRDDAKRELSEYLDSRTISGVWTESYVNGDFVKRFIQEYVVNFYGNGVYLRVHIAQPRDTQRTGIELSWGSREFQGGEVAFVPRSYQQACLVTKEDMR